MPQNAGKDNLGGAASSPGVPSSESLAGELGRRAGSRLGFQTSWNTVPRRAWDAPKGPRTVLKDVPGAAPLLRESTPGLQVNRNLGDHRKFMNSFHHRIHPSKAKPLFQSHYYENAPRPRTNVGATYSDFGGLYDQFRNPAESSLATSMLRHTGIPAAMTVDPSIPAVRNDVSAYYQPDNRRMFFRPDQKGRSLPVLSHELLHGLGSIDGPKMNYEFVPGLTDRAVEAEIGRRQAAMTHAMSLPASAQSLPGLLGQLAGNEARALHGTKYRAGTDVVKESGRLAHLAALRNNFFTPRTQQETMNPYPFMYDWLRSIQKHPAMASPRPATQVNQLRLPKINLGR